MFVFTKLKESFAITFSPFSTAVLRTAWKFWTLQLNSTFWCGIDDTADNSTLLKEAVMMTTLVKCLSALGRTNNDVNLKRTQVTPDFMRKER